MTNVHLCKIFNFLTQVSVIGVVFESSWDSDPGILFVVGCSMCFTSGASLSAIYDMFTGSPSLANREYEPSRKCLPSFLYPRTLAVRPFSKSILQVRRKFKVISSGSV